MTSARPMELDDAVRDALITDPDEVVVAWVAIAVTRTAVDGGRPHLLVSDDAMPSWQVKGILLDALDLVRSGQLDRPDDA